MLWSRVTHATAWLFAPQMEPWKAVSCFGPSIHCFLLGLLVFVSSPTVLHMLYILAKPACAQPSTVMIGK